MPTQTFFNLKEEKRTRIIDAALREFSLHDFEHVNIQNIIKDANISRGSFYQYFEDLDDLFQYLSNMIATQKFAYLKEHGELTENAQFFDRLGELYRLGYQFALDNPLIFKASKHMIKAALSKATTEARIAYLKDELIKDQQNGHINSSVDLDILANVILSFSESLMQSHFIEQALSQTEVSQRFERFIKLLKKGIE